MSAYGSSSSLDASRINELFIGERVGVKATEPVFDTEDETYIIRKDERYVISDIELRDAGGRTRYTFSTTRLKPNKSTRGHSHASDEVYFIEKGMGFMYLGNKGFKVRAGNVVYVPEGIFHKLVNTDNMGIVAHSIMQRTPDRPSF